MCGRYLCEEFQQIVWDLEQRRRAGIWKQGEIFPTNPVPVLRLEEDAVRPDLLTWGFPLKTPGRVAI